MATQLAYSYPAAANILDAHGFSFEQIKKFLIENQSKSGYITTKMIDKAVKDLR